MLAFSIVLILLAQICGSLALVIDEQPIIKKGIDEELAKKLAIRAFRGQAMIGRTPTETLKQATRDEVVIRELRARFNPIAPRSAPSPTAPPAKVTATNGYVLTNFFYGRFNTERDANPNNPVPATCPPKSTTIARTVNQAAAIQSCANFAVSQTCTYNSVANYRYSSFQLYYNVNTNLASESWTCRAYLQPGDRGSGTALTKASATDFNQANAAANPVLGYQM